MLIKKLAELQNQLRVDHKAFASQLGISASHWCNLRQRGCNASPSLIRAVQAQFPELIQYTIGGFPQGDSGIVPPYWKGRSKQQRGKANIMSLSKARRNEDGTCYFCGTTQRLVAHHKDLQGVGSDLPNHTFDNLITLCAICHRKLHSIIRSVEGRIRAAAANPEIQIVRIKVPKRKMTIDLNRLIDIAIRSAAGEPMDSIGSDYNLSRQRVKQILDKAVM